MVQELRELMRECAAEAPYDDGDVDALVRRGRRRVRVRRAGVVAGGALATAAVVGVATLGLPGGGPADLGAAGVPRPNGPVLRLADATAAVEGRDYRTVTSITNENLDEANGQYLEGMTDDGLVLVKDGPHGIHNRVELSLLDPASGQEDVLPDPPGDVGQGFALELSQERLVITSFVMAGGDGMNMRPALAVFDRASRTWSSIEWPDLPAAEQSHVEIGPDGRVYVAVLSQQGRVPEGGWPKGNGGEADDSDAEGDTYHLWSAPMSDPQDLRDEGIDLGSFAFTGGSMVYTDRTNGDPGNVHVRDLATGEERVFDPRTGERCNLLGFGASGDRIVMSQYCGDYPGGVRDDRVQILSTDGEPVTTIQDSGIEGGIASEGADGGLVSITSYARGLAGTYVYDLGTDRLLRLSKDFSRFSTGGGPAPDGFFQWSVAVNHQHGDKELVSRWLG